MGLCHAPSSHALPKKPFFPTSNQTRFLCPVIELSGNFRPRERYVSETPLLIQACNSMNNNCETSFWISHYTCLSVSNFLFTNSLFFHAFFAPFTPIHFLPLSPGLLRICLKYKSLKSHTLSHLAVHICGKQTDRVFF